MYQKVDKMLTNYRELKRSLGLLVFRIENYSRLNTDKTIEELNYASPDGERVSTSGVTDKTPKIAFNYQRITDEHNDSILRELYRRYALQKYELELLEHCISLLETEVSELILDMANGMDNSQLGEKYKMSKTSVWRCRKKAVLEITKMFGEVENVV